MPNRLLKVNAYTTLDLVDAAARGHDFAESGVAVLNVTSPRQDPDHVKFQFEIDNGHLETLPAHADEATLSPEQARSLASALEKHADKVEAAQADDE
jgi:GMP synthase-like glutamine amidotransferase